MSADPKTTSAANFADQHESIQENKREAGLRAERSATGARNSIGLSGHRSGLERSDRK
jgi:hypothetical protein